MESFDYLEAIRASNQYEYALLTSYDFEIGFFESFILNRLLNSGVKKVSVFADGEQLTAALADAKYCFIGKRYAVNPIRIDAAFHPKLFLLLGQNKARLFVSSANLTTSGFCINNEILNEFVYDIDHPENLKIISQAIAFFEKLDEISLGLDRNLFKDIRQLPYYGKSNINHSLFLIDSVNEPILDQIQRLVPAAEEIDIAVPYYDNALCAIDELISRFPGAIIRVWLQNGKSRFPVWRAKDSRFIIKQYRNVSVNEGKAFENGNFYHGKVFRFKNADRSFVFYGSANCTKSALVLSRKSGGNIECGVLEAGDPDEFDSYFDGFIEDATELVCEKLNDEAGEYPNIHFLYGTIENTEAKLFFSCSRIPKTLSVCIGDAEIPFSADQGKIVLSAEAELISGLPEVFTVYFFSEEGKEEVNCWILYKDYLELFRLPDEAGGVFSFDINSEGDKYRQDRIALLSALALSVEDLLKEAEIERHFQKNAAEPDPENNDDDGIIDYTPPSIEVIRQHKIICRIRDIESIFRGRFAAWFTDAFPKAHAKRETGRSSEAVRSVYSNPDQDLSFIRFVKTQYKKLMIPEYQAKVDPERFYSGILIFFDIFDKLTIFSGKKPEEMLLSPLFAAEAKTQLLLSINKMTVSENTAKLLPSLTIRTIVINHLLNAKDNDSLIHSANQKLLASIKQDDEYRTQGYIEQVLSATEILEEQLEKQSEVQTEEQSVQVNAISEIKYVDSLFGYKPLSKIKETIQNDYGKNCLISMDNNRVHVEATAESISSFMTIKEGSLREINNYARMRGQFTSFSADIVLQGISKGPNPAVKISYSVYNLPSTVVYQKIYRKNGKTEQKTNSLNSF